MPATNVVNIEKSCAELPARIFIDSNVLLWACYTRASQVSHHYQVHAYPNFLEAAINRHVKLCVSCINAAELLHVIERLEYKLWSETGTPLTLKEFRKIDSLREEVRSEASAAWSTTLTFAELVQTTLDSAFSSSLTAEFGASRLDSFDALASATCKSNSVKHILTDDSDFGSTTDLTVYTANRRLIELAQDEGRLLN